MNAGESEAISFHYDVTLDILHAHISQTTTSLYYDTATGPTLIFELMEIWEKAKSKVFGFSLSLAEHYDISKSDLSTVVCHLVFKKTKKTWHFRDVISRLTVYFVSKKPGE